MTELPMTEKTPTVAVLGASADRRKFGNKSVRAHAHAGYRVFPFKRAPAGVDQNWVTQLFSQVDGSRPSCHARRGFMGTPYHPRWKRCKTAFRFRNASSNAYAVRVSIQQNILRLYWLHC